jgi:hypothetical protein
LNGKTMDRDNPRGVAALEAVLEAAQETARKSLDLAQSINRREDDYAQDIAFNRAIAFMKVSAKVGMALAKLKGEHTSNVTICRTEVHAPRVELRRPRALETPSPARADAIAAEWMKAHGMKDGDDWPQLYPDPEDAAEDDVPGAVYSPARAAETAADGTAAQVGTDMTKSKGQGGEGDPPQKF